MKTISLRSADAFSSSGVQVDKAAGVIRNCCLMTVGEAKGHGFEIDGTMVGQVASQINAGGGVKMRFTHPQRHDAMGNLLPVEALGTQAGRVSNAHIEGGKLRGDVAFGNYAANLPGLGNVRDYLLDLAASDPTSFGLSVVFRPGTPLNRRDALPLMRSRGVDACDVVADPAANNMGLLSAGAQQGDADAEPSRPRVRRLEPRRRRRGIVVNVNR